MLWTSFQDDIARVIQTAMTSKNVSSGTRIRVGNGFSVPTPVKNEEALRGHANLEDTRECSISVVVAMLLWLVILTLLG
jgi:hypothetical protein